ncbi:Cystathionine gamma-lyase [Talaromyces atroroseus]|uniref:cystathionine gamma-lyase n=1 Tax=Talaromyces atroroseus TaxID=1441469 RepID=A0A225AFU9_TALAT|nr:Cystathionine gamma-lyase [Talaromyces atroroseus]OKL56964.1 Cystathionine gamma-lyase [Talaromyces atroroseus]
MTLSLENPQLKPLVHADVVETPPRPASPEHGFATRAVHAGAHLDPHTGAVIAPVQWKTLTLYARARSRYPRPLRRQVWESQWVCMSIHAAQIPTGKFPRPSPSLIFPLTRFGRDHFEEAIAALEHARFALAFSSGSAATANILQSLAAGSHVISVSDVYGGTHRYFTKVAAAHGVNVTFTPTLEINNEALFRPDTKLIWIESPTNPTLSLVDIREVATIAHRHGIMVVVDNTFMSPYIQNPLDHGADLVVHSVTKYINGHSDVLMGVAAFNSTELKDRLTFLQNAIGAVPSAFDCWLAHRGLKTLHLRAREATRNATAVASVLEASPFVKSVNYPGADSHPQRAIALKQHRDGMGGGMLSFRIQGGHDAAERFCQNVRVFVLAESLGGIESLCEVPSSMTHAGIPKEQREAAGVFDDLVRLSCGIEDAEDLKADILQALAKSVAPASN